MKVALVERSELGGVCLNWGCIPTKALLKSVQALEYAQHAADYGVIAENVKPDLGKIVERSRNIAATMSKGIEYLLKKNKIDLIYGFGRLVAPGVVEVTSDGKSERYSASHIVLATGARARELPSMPIDGRRIIAYRQALTPCHIPRSMAVVGSGAIGVELAWFYKSLGTQVALIEYLPNIIPLEDEDVSAQLSRSFRKAGIKVMTGSSVESVDTSGEMCRLNIVSKKGNEIVECETVLSAVGIAPNIENIGLETLGVELESGRVKVDKFYATNLPGIYAVGDIIATPALAHVASSEAIACVEKIAGIDVEPIDYSCIPSCIYTSPEISSVGMSEKAAATAGYKFRIGKFPYTASGKATAAGAREGFVKLILEAESDKLLGAHAIGAGVTEIIAELSLGYRMGVTGKQIIHTIHPHPTMSEAVMEAAAAAHNEAVHL
jgi:dihydrolipoamide dehydrogenase